DHPRRLLLGHGIRHRGIGARASLSGEVLNTVALGSIFTECNHFGGAPTDLACFERYELRRGSEVLTHATGTIGGMLSVLRKRRMRCLPGKRTHIRMLTAPAYAARACCWTFSPTSAGRRWHWRRCRYSSAACAATPRAPGHLPTLCGSPRVMKARAAC